MKVSTTHCLRVFGYIIMVALLSGCSGGFKNFQAESADDSVVTRTNEPPTLVDNGSDDIGSDLPPGDGAGGDTTGDDDDTPDGESFDTIVENFTQSVAERKVDILFVVDNSGSMQQEQSALADHFEQLITELSTSDFDLQVGVITTDTNNGAQSGKLQGSPLILTSAMSNLVSLFQSNVNVGINGSGSERGLEAARLALSNPLISGYNAGFIRPDSFLNLVIVSDEEDSSQYFNDTDDPTKPWDYPERTVQYYAEQYNLATGGNVRAHAIVGLPEDIGQTCPFGAIPGANNVGTRYIELARDYLPGAVLSLCQSDFSAVISDLALAIEQNDTFPLANMPVPGSVEVKVNSIAYTSSQFTVIDSSAPAKIVFAAGSIPPDNATIEVTYQIPALNP